MDHISNPQTDITEILSHQKEAVGHAYTSVKKMLLNWQFGGGKNGK